jgi:hypothetical protein
LHFLLVFIANRRQITGMTPISSRQCRAARAWLAMPAERLAQLSQIHRDTLRRFEHGEHIMRPSALDRVRSALEAGGVRFTFGRDGEPLGIEDARGD